MSASIHSSSTARVALVSRFQGMLVGAALATKDSQSDIVWWSPVEAIARQLISRAAVKISSSSSQPEQASSGVIGGTTSWEQGLLAMPLFLADFDQFTDWPRSEAWIFHYWDAHGRKGTAQNQDGDRQEQTFNGQERKAASLSLALSLPYRLVPLALSRILRSDSPSGCSCQKLLKSLEASLPTDGDNWESKVAQILCRPLLQCVDQAIDSSQSLDGFLQKVRQVVEDARLTLTTLALTTSVDDDTATFSQAAADGVLVAVLLYSLVFTPAEYDTTLQRFRRALNSEEMNQFEVFQPYLKSAQQSAIATLGGLLGACGGQSSLPLRRFQLTAKSRGSATQAQFLDDNLYTELMVWGVRLWAFWSGVLPSVCLQLNSSETEEMSVSPELLANMGITTSPNLIRVFGC